MPMSDREENGMRMASPTGSGRTGAGQSSSRLASVQSSGVGVGVGVAVGSALGATTAGWLGAALGVGLGPPIEGWPRWIRKNAPPTRSTPMTAAAASAQRLDVGLTVFQGRRA